MSTLNIQFDYTYDANHFFDAQAKKDLLQQVASVFEAQLNVNLSAIQPGGINTWTANFQNPATGAVQAIIDLGMPADTIIVYVGGRALSSGEAGLAGPGGYSDLGTTDWLNIVAARGVAGALSIPPTAFVPWGGAIAFDTATNWFFGSTTSGLTSNQVDFISVATHELSHVLGFGTSNTFSGWISGGQFTGPHAVASFGGNVPLSPDQGHWAQSVTSNGQSPVMTPSLTDGVRKSITPLDWAGLQDVGWNVNPFIDTAPPTANLTTANVTSPSGGTYTFTVAYSDNVAVNVATLGTSNVAVTGPNSFSQNATFISVDTNSNGTPRTATYRLNVPNGSGWTTSDNGTYTVSMAANQVKDTSGNAVAAGSLGTFSVNVDTVVPTASLAAASVTTPGAGTYTFTVAYSDNVAISVASLATGNVTVTGPNSFSQNAAFVSVDTNSNGTPRTATYRINVPNGSRWTTNDNGTYTASMAANQVKDTSGNAVAAGSLGTFNVSVDTVVPTASLTASGVTAPGAGTYTFTVTYSDNVAVNVATLGAGNVTVTGPNAFNQNAAFVSVDTNSNGTPRTGTYRINVPNGTGWTASDNGTYAVGMFANQVKDTSGNAVGAGSLGTFSVNVPIVASNHAPVLDASVAPYYIAGVGSRLPAEMTNGILVSALLATGAGGNPISDADAGAKPGIAITADDTSLGTWQYTLVASPQSGDWINVEAAGAISSTSALLLPTTAHLRFTTGLIPHHAVGGPFLPLESKLDAGITFRAWDQTTGTVGARADTSTNGGSTAFSTATVAAGTYFEARLFRSYNTVASLNYYTLEAEFNAITGNPLIVDRSTSTYTGFTILMSPIPGVPTVPLYRMYYGIQFNANNTETDMGYRYLTTNAGEASFLEGLGPADKVAVRDGTYFREQGVNNGSAILGYIYSTQQPGTVQMSQVYRLDNVLKPTRLGGTQTQTTPVSQQNGDHVYTTNAAVEITQTGTWRQESNRGFVVELSPAATAVSTSDSTATTLVSVASVSVAETSQTSILVSDQQTVSAAVQIQSSPAIALQPDGAKSSTTTETKQSFDTTGSQAGAWEPGGAGAWEPGEAEDTESPEATALDQFWESAGQQLSSRVTAWLE